MFLFIIQFFPKFARLDLKVAIIRVIIRALFRLKVFRDDTTYQFYRE